MAADEDDRGLIAADRAVRFMAFTMAASGTLPPFTKRVLNEFPFGAFFLGPNFYRAWKGTRTTCDSTAFSCLFS